MTLKTRLAKLEKQTLPKAGTWRDFVEGKVPPEMWERGMNTLAETLGVTREELKKELKELNHEQKTTNKAT